MIYTKGKPVSTGLGNPTAKTRQRSRELSLVGKARRWRELHMRALSKNWKLREQIRTRKARRIRRWRRVKENVRAPSLTPAMIGAARLWRNLPRRSFSASSPMSGGISFNYIGSLWRLFRNYGTVSFWLCPDY